MQGSLSIERMCQLAGQPGGLLPVAAGAGCRWKRRWKFGRRFRRSSSSTGGATATGESRGAAAPRDAGESQARGAADA
jgi:hypothetical protein